jgi:hypothetical protein
LQEYYINPQTLKPETNIQHPHELFSAVTSGEWFLFACGVNRDFVRFVGSFCRKKNFQGRNPWICGKKAGFDHE